jgi:hypothetical protein
LADTPRGPLATSRRQRDYPPATLSGWGCRRSTGSPRKISSTTPPATCFIAPVAPTPAGFGHRSRSPHAPRFDLSGHRPSVTADQTSLSRSATTTRCSDIRAASRGSTERRPQARTQASPWWRATPRQRGAAAGSQPSRVPLAALGDSAGLELRPCPLHAHHHGLSHLLSPRDPARRASGQRQPLPRLHQLPRPRGTPARAPHRRRQPARQGRTRPRPPPQDRRHLDRLQADRASDEAPAPARALLPALQPVEPAGGVCFTDIPADVARDLAPLKPGMTLSTSTRDTSRALAPAFPAARSRPPECVATRPALLSRSGRRPAPAGAPLTGLS